MSKPSYIIVRGCFDEVERLVNARMAEGYIPTGGLTHGDTGYLNSRWSQAMYMPQPAPVVNEEHKTILKEPVVDPTPQAMLHPAQRPDNVGEKVTTLRDLEYYADPDGKTLLLLERAYRIAAGTGYTGDDSLNDHKALVEILVAVEDRTRYLINRVREYSGRAPLTVTDYQKTTHAELIELISRRVAQNDNLVNAAMAIDACMRYRKSSSMQLSFETLHAVHKALAGYETAQYQDPLVVEFLQRVNGGKEAE